MTLVGCDGFEGVQYNLERALLTFWHQPGVMFYLSMWYIRRERQFRIAMFFSAAALAGAFGGILAYGIAFMDGVGGLGGWAWIFILEGILTALVGVLAYWFICNYPDVSESQISLRCSKPNLSIANILDTG